MKDETSVGGVSDYVHNLLMEIDDLAHEVAINSIRLGVKQSHEAVIMALASYWRNVSDDVKKVIALVYTYGSCVDEFYDESANDAQKEERDAKLEALSEEIRSAFVEVMPQLTDESVQ